MSTKNPDAPQPEQQPGQQPASSGSRWEPTEAEANAPTEQVPAAAAGEVPPPPPAAPAAYPAGEQPVAQPVNQPANQARTNATFASIRALSKGAKGALAGAAAVLVLGSGVTGFAIGQAGDDGHQRIDVRFGQTGFDRDGDGRGFPGQPGQMGHLPGQLGQQGGTGQFEGQLPQQAPQQDDGSES